MADTQSEKLTQVAEATAGEAVQFIGMEFPADEPCYVSLELSFDGGVTFPQSIQGECHPDESGMIRIGISAVRGYKFDGVVTRVFAKSEKSELKIEPRIIEQKMLPERAAVALKHDSLMVVTRDPEELQRLEAAAKAEIDAIAEAVSSEKAP